jgi:flavorubredoxin
MKSLTLIKSLKPVCIYPGHGPVVLDPEKHVQAYIDNRNNRERQILAALTEHKNRAMSAMDLVEVIYTVMFIHVNTEYTSCVHCFFCYFHQRRVARLRIKVHMY